MKLSRLVLNLLYGWSWSWIFYASFLAFRVTRITGLYHQVWHKSLSIWRNLMGLHIPLSFYPVYRSGHPISVSAPSPPSLARSSWWSSEPGQMTSTSDSRVLGLYACGTMPSTKPRTSCLWGQHSTNWMPPLANSSHHTTTTSHPACLFWAMGWSHSV